MEIADHINAVAQEGKSLAAAARENGLDAEIPYCPGWDMRELLRHLSEIHLWAAGIISKRTDKLWPDDISEHLETWPDLAVFWPDDKDLADFYLATNANLVEVLNAAPLDLDCPTFLPAPSPLAMWARRQAHETAVHRFDAQVGPDGGSGFEPTFASDGIDEILSCFAPRGSGFPVESARTMLVHAKDTDDSWLVTMAPDGVSTTRSSGSADVTLTGDASDLYLSMWNRGTDPKLTIQGDEDVLDVWHQNHRIRWTT